MIQIDELKEGAPKSLQQGNLLVRGRESGASPEFLQKTPSVPDAFSPVSLARNILRFNTCSSSQMQKREWLPARKIGFIPRGSFHWGVNLQAESNLQPGSNPQAEKIPGHGPQTPGPQLIRQFNIWRRARHPPRV